MGFLSPPTPNVAPPPPPPPPVPPAANPPTYASSAAQAAGGKKQNMVGAALTAGFENSLFTSPQGAASAPAVKQNLLGT